MSSLNDSYTDIMNINVKNNLELNQTPLTNRGTTQLVFGSVADVAISAAQTPRVDISVRANQESGIEFDQLN